MIIIVPSANKNSRILIFESVFDINFNDPSTPEASDPAIALDSFKIFSSGIFIAFWTV